MKDNFSRQSEAYRAYRPDYPQDLFEYIFSFVNCKDRAWDAGTGNGQVASVLADYFSEVYATDISEKQLHSAIKKDNLHYSVAPAEQTYFKEDTFDLITVGQAIHWFDLKRFSEEVRRVGKKEAVIAFWGYGIPGLSSAIDNEIHKFYSQVIGAYWDPERKHIDRELRTIELDFDELPGKKLNMDFEWTFSRLEGYFNTWSSVQKYIQINRKNPVPEFMDRIKPLWGEAENRIISFPVFLRLGRVRK